MRKDKNIYYQLRESTETDNSPALTQIELAKAFADDGNPLAQSIISKIETSKENPPSVSYNVLRAYSQHFNVTTDYLLGLRETSLVDENIAMINKVTGLSEKSIDTLKSLYTENMPELLETLNYIIGTDSYMFSCFVDAIGMYLDGEYDTPLRFDFNENGFVSIDDGTSNSPIVKTQEKSVTIGRFDASLRNGEGGYHARNIPISILKEAYSFQAVQDILKFWKENKKGK